MTLILPLSFLAVTIAASAFAQESPSAGSKSVGAVAALVGGRSLYEVKAGDTVTSVGARFGVARATLTEMNHLTPPYALAPGQSLA